MFTEFLNTRKDSKIPSHKTEVEMPKEVLGMNVDELLKMIGLTMVNASNAGCLLILVLRLRQCCSHMSLMCQVKFFLKLSIMKIHQKKEF